MKKPSASLVKKFTLPGPANAATVFVCDDFTDLATKAAEFLMDSIPPHPFHLVLSGGSTPRAIYEQLATAGRDWSQVHFYWGDERCVPPDDPESNFRMAHASLLSKIPVRESQIHRMRGELDPEEAASEYVQQLRKVFPEQFLPSFDFIFLGLGDDGHTASLFPHTEALNISDRWVVSQFVEKVRSSRVTLTVPALNQGAKVVFLVSGKSKVEALNRVLSGPYNPQECPAQWIRPKSGELYFFTDVPAAL